MYSHSKSGPTFRNSEPSRNSKLSRFNQFGEDETSLLSRQINKPPDCLKRNFVYEYPQIVAGFVDSSVRENCVIFVG